MAMKPIRAVVASTVLIVLMMSLCVVVPEQASAREYSGVSPPFAPDTGWALYVDYCGVGDIICWYWTTSDSLSFYLLNTPSMTEIHGFSNYDGHVVNTAGWYNLIWFNNNWFFSATVTFAVLVFTPSLSISSPIDGAYLNSRTIAVQGAYDGHADGVLVGPDAMHFRKANVAGTNWGVDDFVLPEGQSTILVRSYYLLDYYGTKNCTLDATVQVNVDTVPPELQLTKPAAESYVAGTVDMTWQCSDGNGVAKREVKVDAADWVTVTTNTYTTQVEDGYHWVGVRITDVAGNTAFTEVRVFSDTVAPEVWIQQPEINSKISKDHVNVTWIGGDYQSGLDHYEVQINGGQWIDVGYATSYEFTNLDDVWYSVSVKVVDKSGNAATSTVGFGIYTSIWSQNGPYNGIPLYAVIAVVIIAAILSVLLYWRKRGVATKPPPEEPPPETQ